MAEVFVGLNWAFGYAAGLNALARMQQYRHGADVARECGHAWPPERQTLRSVLPGWEGSRDDAATCGRPVSRHRLDHWRRHRLRNRTYRDSGHVDGRIRRTRSGICQSGRRPGHPRKRGVPAMEPDQLESGRTIGRRQFAGSVARCGHSQSVAGAVFEAGRATIRFSVASAI